MENDQREDIIKKYNEGMASPDEVKTIEKLIRDNEIQLTDLRDIALLEEDLSALKAAGPSRELDVRFYQMLGRERERSERWQSMWSWISGRFSVTRLALASLLLTAGFLGGYFLNKPGQQSEVASLTQEINGLKEMVMLSLLERESATDRLRAVSLTSEMSDVSTRVTRALIQTLNQDANVNVRLAALEALYPYSQNSQVREALIHSIARQSSPLVQVALADMMVLLQEKKSVEELKKILEDENTPNQIKERIREKIQILI